MKTFFRILREMNKKAVDGQRAAMRMGTFCGGLFPRNGRPDGQDLYVHLIFLITKEGKIHDTGYCTASSG